MVFQFIAKTLGIYLLMLAFFLKRVSFSGRPAALVTVYKIESKYLAKAIAFHHSCSILYSYANRAKKNQ